MQLWAPRLTSQIQAFWTRLPSSWPNIWTQQVPVPCSLLQSYNVGLFVIVFIDGETEALTVLSNFSR